jgi:hypothetical protein
MLKLLLITVAILAGLITSPVHAQEFVGNWATGGMKKNAEQAKQGSKPIATRSVISQTQPRKQTTSLAEAMKNKQKAEKKRAVDHKAKKQRMKKRVKLGAAGSYNIHSLTHGSARHA